MGQISVWELALRLVAASVLGGVVGLERESHNRPAGLRTHTLVCLGSALMMLVSIYGFDMQLAQGRTGDPARIAAQVVSGIGFLGAGTIMRQGSTIRGLTTAASLWVVAGIGLAVGGGLYIAACLATAMVLISLIFFDRIGNRLAERRDCILIIRATDRPGILGQIGTVLGDYYVNIRQVQMENEDDSDELTIHMTVRTPNHLNFDELTRSLATTAGIGGVEWDGRDQQRFFGT